MYHIYH